MSTQVNPRTSQQVAKQVWTAWPFDDGSWAWPHPSASNAPLRVEEMVDDGQVVVRAELPGVDPVDIEVLVDDGVLTVRAERHESQQDRSARSYRTEFRYGAFERQIRLPQGATAEVVSATYRDGVLEVRMPAPAPASGTRRIEVERG